MGSLAGAWRVGATLSLCAMTLSCSWIHRGGTSCRDPAIPVAAEDAPLRVPAGREVPDTRNAIRVPPLNEPEKPRAPAAPCLSQPPSYGS